MNNNIMQVHDELLISIPINHDEEKKKVIDSVMEHITKQHYRLIFMLMHGYKIYEKFGWENGDFNNEDVYHKTEEEFRNRTVTELCKIFSENDILMWKENLTPEEENNLKMLQELKK